MSVFRWGLTLQLSLPLAADSAHPPSTWFIWAPVGPVWGKAHLGALNTFPCQAEEKSCTCRIRKLPRGLWPEVNLQFLKAALDPDTDITCLLLITSQMLLHIFLPLPWILETGMLLKCSTNHSTCKQLTYNYWAPCAKCSGEWENESWWACSSVCWSTGDSNDKVMRGASGEHCALQRGETC